MAKKKVHYVEHLAAFDIETSSYMDEGEKRAVVYSYALAIDDTIYHARSADEFFPLLEKIAAEMELSLDRRLVIYVHNLAYEWQFIKHYMAWESAFAISSDRRIVRAVSKLGIEFRCSYVLTNKPLAAVGKDVGVQKMVGDIDHTLIRNSITPLSDEEMGYIDNDVRILIEFERQALAQEGGSIEQALHSIPITKTGYVRRRMRKAALADPAYEQLISELTLTEETYTLARHSFQGGYTHANSTVMGQEMGDTVAVDLASSYPSSMLQFTYPMSSFHSVAHEFTAEELDKCIGHIHFFVTFVVYDAVSRYPFPYISLSKALSIADPFVDNGRVYSAANMTLTMTDVDWQIFRRCYEVERIEIVDVMMAPAEYLPAAITDPIVAMYGDKTALKGVAGQEVNYRSAKEDINGVYGSVAMDPVRTDFEFNAEDSEFVAAIPTTEDALSKHNNSRSRYLFYPWAAWVTAYSRYVLLMTMYDLIDAGVTVMYCDTDSIYHKPSPEAQGIIDRVNSEVRERLSAAMHYRWFYASDEEVEDALAPKDIKGVRHHIGLFEVDGHYDNFKTLGAKRYAVMKGAQFKITVAGLSKGAASYIEEIGGMNAFVDGLTIPAEKSGRLTHTYSEETAKNLITDYMGNTCRMEQHGFIHLEPSPYVLTVSDDYTRFVQRVAEGRLFEFA
nr:MAG TPA: DNA polymerase B [Caudoviricetes sp.]